MLALGEMEVEGEMDGEGLTEAEGEDDGEGETEGEPAAANSASIIVPAHHGSGAASFVKQRARRSLKLPAPLTTVHAPPVGAVA